MKWQNVLYEHSFRVSKQCDFCLKSLQSPGFVHRLCLIGFNVGKNRKAGSYFRGKLKTTYGRMPTSTFYINGQRYRIVPIGSRILAMVLRLTLPTMATGFVGNSFSKIAFCVVRKMMPGEAI